MPRRKIANLEIVDGCTIIDNVESPLRLSKLPPQLTDNVNVIVSGPLDDADARKLSQYVGQFKNVMLGIGPEPTSGYTLQFLKHFPSLQTFYLMDQEFDREAELLHLPQALRELNLSGGRLKLLSLRFLERLNKLQRLGLEGQTKDIDSLSSLKELRELMVYSLTLPNLEILLPLKRLESLNIRLGGTSNLDLVHKIGRLRYLELWRIRGLSDLDWLQEVRTLQYLWLQTLGQVQSLPSLKPLRRLRRVHLEAMNGLSDLAPIADAPNLEDLVISEMKHLPPSAFSPFVGHRKLRTTIIVLGSKKKEETVDAMLPFPLVEYPFRFDGE